MPFVPMNVILDHPLPKNSTLSLPYPEGKNEGHFFGAVNHTVSIDGVFFRSPRDFTLITQPDRVVFVWQGEMTLPASSLLHMQLEIPGGDFYYDAKVGITVLNMVHSPLFMVNLAAPAADDEGYWVQPTPVNEVRSLTLAQTQIPTARNVIIHTENDNSHCTFVIEGEDIYRRAVLEKITASSTGKAEGGKAFARINRITPSHPCNGKIQIGTGNKLGLPVFLPSPGYLIREIINGVTVTGGTVVSGETAIPTATTGDRRGTYTPPPTITLDNKQSIHLLLSLLAPGNIGIPDYAG